MRHLPTLACIGLLVLSGCQAAAHPTVTVTWTPLPSGAATAPGHQGGTPGPTGPSSAPTLVRIQPQVLGEEQVALLRSASVPTAAQSGRGLLLTDAADVEALDSLPHAGTLDRLKEALRAGLAQRPPTPQRPWLLSSIHWGINCPDPRGQVVRDPLLLTIRLKEVTGSCRGGGAETRVHVVAFTPDDGPLPRTVREAVAHGTGGDAVPATAVLVDSGALPTSLIPGGDPNSSARFRAQEQQGYLIAGREDLDTLARSWQADDGPRLHAALAARFETEPATPENPWLLFGIDGTPSCQPTVQVRTDPHGGPVRLTPQGPCRGDSKGTTTVVVMRLTDPAGLVLPRRVSTLF